MGKLLALYLIAVAVQLVHARFPNLEKKPFSHKPLHAVGDPLKLTPFLERNQIAEARNASEVHLQDFQDIISYSGYLTVDKKNNGNLFFWFFPSVSNYTEDPVVLWLQGGPGASSLYALFVENGPFEVVNGTVLLRQTSWNRNHSILYIDQPLGTGFSFSDDYLVTDQTEVGEHLYSALTQFFTLFPELQRNEFYVAGESYAGKYIPAIGHTIHNKNPTADLKINLQGLLIGNGLSDPLHQFRYGDILYQIGLIDLPTLESFSGDEDVAVNYMKQGDYYSATDTWNRIMGPMFQQYTGLDNVYNFLKDENDDPTEWQQFIVQDNVRQALHVGSSSYSSVNYDVYNGLYADITKSVAPWVAELLSHYRVLIFNGQLDIIVGYALTENYLQHLNFSAADDYKTAARQIWYVDDLVAGYVKTAGNLTEVLVRNAGHMVPADQPEFAYDLISKFIRNEPIASQ